jgi:acetate kinase
MREIISLAEKGDTQAGLALDIFCYRIKKYIGAYAAVLGRLDALVFTGGIGEHNAKIRRMICEGLQILGLEIDQNGKPEDKGVREISSQNSKVNVLVVATNEELEIASQTYNLLNK